MSAIGLVTAFNDAINVRDLESLIESITDDHEFVDSAGGATSGRSAVRAAWAGFFNAFPDYCNHFEEMHERGDTVFIRGHSTCSFEPLQGRAIWIATVRDGLLCRWEVLEDAHETWSSLLEPRD